MKPCRGFSGQRRRSDRHPGSGARAGHPAGHALDRRSGSFPGRVRNPPPPRTRAGVVHPVVRRDRDPEPRTRRARSGSPSTRRPCSTGATSGSTTTSWWKGRRWSGTTWRSRSRWRRSGRR